MSSLAENLQRQEDTRPNTDRCSVASVTVAYNSSSILPRQLDALRKQTRKLDEIVVVDNASSDDTSSLLTAQFPEVTLLNQGENLGVGGGYSAGLLHTIQKHDWTWLLDADSVPAPDALEHLLGVGEHLGSDAQNTAILASLCVNSETGHIYPGLMWRHGWRYTDNQALAHRAVFVDSVISSGTLLKREAVQRVGLPRTDFFIDFVDHEYCLRLRRAGYAIAIVTTSRLDHKIGNSRRIDFMGLSKKWVDHAPWREYYMARNEIFTIWQYYPDWRSKGAVLRQLIRHLFDIMLFATQKTARLRMIAQGIRDARAGTLGIRYLPARVSGVMAETEAVELRGSRT